jgi:hypothetical protein
MTAVIEMNVGLDVRGESNSLAACGERAIQAITYLINQFGREAVQTRRAQVQYEGPNGLVLEDTLIVRLELNTMSVVYRRIPYLAYRLAQNLSQDCIGVYWVNQGVGRLVGPEAASWGSFDLDFFTSFGDVEPDMAVAA